jgi:hypothetical protein
MIWFISEVGGLKLFLSTFVCLIALSVFKRKYPLNYCALAAFTLLEALQLGAVCMVVVAQDNGQALLTALVVTLAIFVNLTVFASGRDFSYLKHGLCACLFGLAVLGLLHLFYPFGSAMLVAYHAAGIVIFCGYVLYDTHRLENELDPDDYIVAVIELYLDIVNLFLHILSLILEIQKKKDKEKEKEKK